ncbi:malto-oligosyltrehalose trehalohydrolase [Gluconacetobacter diazotrophicus PA1 5]|uniref:Malto-oligosyltrehalose trehalohydrolase n=1 Tax=Gluconacetobacter diazotrophicus (strain ATCC 49037 / DSM 5601 / CCUG 37298 / CIP 103539 / LMG 7603 / PAl5) TaxID=272568 RepID=A9H852_GLUDA|nr:malto-oligosyltrehalose trehalohydrolase [Gluconacetobacter diazotrophicus]ACI51241.1 malto-oligosyltrehalose trehalohydrolase [Gluconacetobacter diazotrophicus PA1 5]TWB09789.1 maltooligosyl trehalose hydrolase [Gluconacetobacter diazotrophicus]CAP54489.1 putative malto-oligosyltrehalose trehalohydrolase [Gluconacetobacter diazotrophicus PA1 5]
MRTTHAFACTFGATMITPHQTRFRLWAPSCDTVDLEIEGAAPIAMTRQPDGAFEIVAPCGAGARYRYRVRPDLAVADPASRAQPDDVFGPSMVVDPRAYAWTVNDWCGMPWERTVIYEIHVGIAGGFQGVRARLSQLAALGITAVQLMPLSEFPGGRNWGYDGVLPYAPESSYGTPEDLKALIDHAHGLGMMVFLDVVYNHFGPDGNFLSAYAAPFFRSDRPTPWGEAIDFRQPAVRTYFTENALYWLMEYRFDGLRLDAVHAIADRDWLVELAARVRARTEAGRHVHLILENENNDAGLLQSGFDAQWNDDGHNALHVLLTGEDEGYYRNFSDDPTAHLARVLGQGFAFQGEVFPTLKRPRGMPSGSLPPSAFILFLQNHDQIGNRALGDRLTVLADPRALRAAYGLLLLSPQIPLLFMGEEWGSRRPFLFFTSHSPHLGQIVRDGRRREFAAFAHFSDPARREQIPDPNQPETFAASVPNAREAAGPAGRGWQDLFATLLRLRRHHVVPRLRGARGLGAQPIGPAAVAARWRMGDGAVLAIALNLGEGVVPLPDWVAGTVLFDGSPADGSPATPAPPQRDLDPYSVTVRLLEVAHG